MNEDKKSCESLFVKHTWLGIICGMLSGFILFIITLPLAEYYLLNVSLSSLAYFAIWDFIWFEIFEFFGVLFFVLPKRHLTAWSVVFVPTLFIVSTFIFSSLLL